MSELDDGLHRLCFRFTLQGPWHHLFFEDAGIQHPGLEILGQHKAGGIRTREVCRDIATLPVGPFQ